MRRRYPYETFQTDTKYLLQKLHALDIDTIIAVARGGLALAQTIAYAKNVRDVQLLHVYAYDGMQKRSKIEIRDYTKLPPKGTALVVDDIADSGETLQAVMEYFTKTYPHIRFYSATLFYKKSSLYEPTYWVREANEWIDFFWEVDFMREPS